jgi:ferric-dicitrate binding protein FerR (iron transport regulator)
MYVMNLIDAIKGVLRDDALTDAEVDTLGRWLASDAGREEFDRETDALFADPTPDHAAALERIGRRLDRRIDRRETGKKRRVVWRTAAACAAVAAATTALFVFGDRGQSDATPQEPQSRVRVVLADGKEVGLTPATTRVELGGGAISQNEWGYAVTPEAGAAVANAASRIVTERGGEINFMLSDGTKVWLNACSELSFPVDFGGATRSVELRGQACFEVAPDALRPFVVTADGMEIEALGTSFDVEAYDDDPTRSATLLSGRVRVAAAGQTVELDPGFAAVLDTGVGRLTVRPADTGATAWRDGWLVFHDETIESVVRKLSRWYDVEFVFDRDFAGLYTFNGRVGKSDPLPEVLERITLTGGPSFRTVGATVYIR